MSLTQEQKDEIREMAIQHQVDAAKEDEKYLRGLAASYVGSLSHEEVVNSICSTPEAWPSVFSCHPLTGLPWAKDVASFIFELVALGPTKEQVQAIWARYEDWAVSGTLGELGTVPLEKAITVPVFGMVLVVEENGYVHS